MSFSIILRTATIALTFLNLLLSSVSTTQTGLMVPEISYWGSQAHLDDNNKVLYKYADERTLGFFKPSSTSKMPGGGREVLLKDRLNNSLPTAFGFLAASLLVVNRVANIFREPLIVYLFLLPPVLIFTIVTTFYLPELQTFSSNSKLQIGV